MAVTWEEAVAAFEEATGIKEEAANTAEAQVTFSRGALHCAMGASMDQAVSTQSLELDSAGQ